MLGEMRVIVDMCTSPSFWKAAAEPAEEATGWASSACQSSANSSSRSPSCACRKCARVE